MKLKLELVGSKIKNRYHPHDNGVWGLWCRCVCSVYGLILTRTPSQRIFSSASANFMLDIAWTLQVKDKYCVAVHLNVYLKTHFIKIQKYLTNVNKFAACKPCSPNYDLSIVQRGAIRAFPSYLWQQAIRGFYVKAFFLWKHILENSV